MTTLRDRRAKVWCWYIYPFLYLHGENIHFPSITTDIKKEAPFSEIWCIKEHRDIRDENKKGMLEPIPCFLWNSSAELTFLTFFWVERVNNEGLMLEWIRLESVKYTFLHLVHQGIYFEQRKSNCNFSILLKPHRTVALDSNDIPKSMKLQGA